MYNAAGAEESSCVIRRESCNSVDLVSLPHLFRRVSVELKMVSFRQPRQESRADSNRFGKEACVPRGDNFLHGQQIPKLELDADFSYLPSFPRTGFAGFLG